MFGKLSIAPALPLGRLVIAQSSSFRVSNLACPSLRAAPTTAGMWRLRAYPWCGDDGASADQVSCRNASPLSSRGFMVRTRKRLAAPRPAMHSYRTKPEPVEGIKAVNGSRNAEALDNKAMFQPGYIGS